MEFITRVDTGGNKIEMKTQYYIKNVRTMLQKHKAVCFLTILFVAVSQILLGYALQQNDLSVRSVKKFDQTYGKNTKFYCSDSISDRKLTQYLNGEDSYAFQKLLKLRKKLSETSGFMFTEETVNDCLEIIDQKIPEECLDGYEDGMAEGGQEIDGEMLYQVKNICVSRSFFDIFSIDVEAGKMFSKEDYQLKETDEIPVLGKRYSKIFQIGDTFPAYYQGNKMNFYVKGFIKEKCFFENNAMNRIDSCEGYVIIPSFQVEKESTFSRWYLLSKVNGMITSKLGYEKTNELYGKYAGECGLENWGFMLLNPRGITNLSEMLEQYSAMSKEVAHQFQKLVELVIAFGCISITMILCGILKENHQNFGVKMLCGASLGAIAEEILGMICFLLFSGDLLAILFLMIQNVAGTILLYTQGIIVLSTVVASVGCLLYLRHMDITDIIGGKE